MIAEIEVLVRTAEQAQKFGAGKFVRTGSVDLHRSLARSESREAIARLVIDWAAGYGNLEVDVHGPVEAETEEL